MIAAIVATVGVAVAVAWCGRVIIVAHHCGATIGTTTATTGVDTNVAHVSNGASHRMVVTRATQH